MKPKIILTVCLLAFVAVSVAQLFVQQTTQATDSPQASPLPPQPTGGPTDTAALPTSETASSNKVIAYYFHGNKRCYTCRAIEAYSKEAFDTGFPEALESGAIEWRIVNVNEAENDHFIEKFELITRSVVLARLGATTASSWRNLDQVWDLVGDKEAFIQYIQDETRLFLAETPE